MGYAVLDYDGAAYSLLECGVLTTDKDDNIPVRLKSLYADLMEISAEYMPDAASIEQLFFNDNAKTAIGVGEARGTAILACANSGVEVFEYTPLQIKQALSGYGRADKKQIQEIVRSLLGLAEAPKPDDAADAVAAAICHANTAGFTAKLK
jgi:crossover junction endodeoxyribonuclease RuvC